MFEHVCAHGIALLSSCTKQHEGVGSKPTAGIPHAPVANIRMCVGVSIGINFLCSCVSSWPSSSMRRKRVLSKDSLFRT